MKKLMVVLLVVCAGVVNAGSLDNPTNVFEHFPNVNVDAHMLKIAQQHFQDIRNGTIPADTNELARARRIPLLDWNHATSQQIAGWFRRTLYAWAVGGEPRKEWRVSNQIDIWRWAAFRSDAFWSSQHLGERDCEMNPLIAGLSRLDICSLKQVCAEDECARDVIIGIGLVCKDLPLAKELAMELAWQSEVNWPVYALRIPYEDAAKLLADKPEYARLLSNLAIREMEPGRERCKAIKAHFAKFPDYTEEDMPKTSIALNTHAELAAVAGSDLVNAGKFWDAMDLWLTYGGCPEDVALVAEQVLTLARLRRLCDLFPLSPTRELPSAHPRMPRPWSVYCSRNGGSGRSLIVDDAQVLRRYVRTIFAKRLMRAGREEEAVEWFDDSRDIVLAKRYVQLKVLGERAASVDQHFKAYMTLGALMRQGADRLFGTELEPDNMICDGQHACEWAKNDERLRQKRNITETKRFHYRWRTADCYFKAGKKLDDNIDESLRNAQDNGTCWSAVLTNRMPDRLRRDFAFWNVGDILRYRDSERAYDIDVYYGVTQPITGVIGLFPVTNSVGAVVTNQAWQIASKLPSPFKEWHQTDNWLGDDPLVAFTNKMFSPNVVALPPHHDNAKDLLRIGEELFEVADRTGDFSEKGFAAALYAFYLAGQKGSALGYQRCCAYFVDQIGDYTLAIPFIKAAMTIDANLPAVRYYYARILCEIGMRNDAFKIVQSIVDNECADRETELLALGFLCKYYEDGSLRKLMTEEMFDRYYDRYCRLSSLLENGNGKK